MRRTSPHPLTRRGTRERRPAALAPPTLRPARARSSAPCFGRRRSAARSRSWPPSSRWCGPTSTTPSYTGPATPAAGTAGRRALGRRRGADRFFFVAGLELKRELLVGSLRRPADAAVPVVAAVCGVAVPALSTCSSTSAVATPGAGRSRAPPTSPSRWPCSPSSGPPADAAAGVPADPGGRRRPDRDRDHRGLLHRRALLRLARRRAGAAGGVRRAPAAARLQHPGLRPARGATWWCVHESGVHATWPASRSGCSRGLSPTPTGPLPRRTSGHRLVPLSVGVGRTVLRAPESGVVFQLRCPGNAGRAGRELGLVVGKPLGVLGGAWLVTRFSPTRRFPLASVGATCLGVARWWLSGSTVSLLHFDGEDARRRTRRARWGPSAPAPPAALVLGCCSRAHREGCTDLGGFPRWVSLRGASDRRSARALALPGSPPNRERSERFCGVVAWRRREPWRRHGD